MAITQYELGIREQISWAEESTYGTAVTPDTIVGKDVVVEPQFDQGWMEILQSGDQSRTVHDRVEGPLSLPFTLRFKVCTWEFLKYLYAGLSESGSGPYTHTLSVDSTINSFTLEWAKPRGTNLVITLAGCVMKSATINFRRGTVGSADGFLEVVAQCQAQSYTTGTSITSLSELSLNPFQYRHVTFTLDNTEIQEITSGSINIDQGINPEQDSRYANTTYDNKIGEPIAKTFRVTGNYTVNIKDDTHFDLWDAATTVSNTSLVFEKDSTDKVTFDMTDFRLATPGPAATNMEGVNNVQMGWTAKNTEPVVIDDITSY